METGKAIGRLGLGVVGLALVVVAMGCDGRPVKVTDPGRIDGAIVVSPDLALAPDKFVPLPPDAHRSDHPPYVPVDLGIPLLDIRADVPLLPDLGATPLPPDLGATPPAICGASLAVRVDEIAVGQPDFIVLKNYSKTPVDVAGFRLVMTGIAPPAPDIFTLPQRTLGPGQTLVVVEHSKGSPSSISTGANIPFYDGPPAADRPNALALHDGKGLLVDYWAVGQVVNLPQGATYLAAPWLSSFESKKHSFHRVANKGICPRFEASDWSVGALSQL